MNRRTGGSVHIPDREIAGLDLLGFDEALKAEPLLQYDQEQWVYAPPFYAPYRYLLGTAGRKPLICVGLNPSTAEPGRLDNTLKSVQRIALYNGYDSFLMMNLYAQRATRPCDMDRSVCDFLAGENLRAFRYLLGRTKTVWAAWGAVMETRGYLALCMRDFIRAGREEGARWFFAGNRSRKGHPHHPLYLRKDSLLEPFDAEEYLAVMEASDAL